MSATIQRLAKAPREMTAEQAGLVIDRSRDFIGRAITSTKPGVVKLEARQDNARGSGANVRYIISREALLVYIVRTTSGDKLALMSAIKLALPHLLPLAQLAAKDSCASPQDKAPAPLPDNVIPIKRGHAKRPPADPFAGHPEFPFSNSASA